MSILTNLVKKNLLLNKRRTIVTIISIILSCALIGGVATLFISFQNFMQRVEIETGGNYHAIFNNIPVEKAKYIEHNPYIKGSMESYNIGYSKLVNSKNEYKPYLYIAGYDKNKLESSPIKLLSGVLPSNENEIIISNQMIEEGSANYKLDDTITLEIGKRLLEDKELTQLDPYLTYSYDGKSTIKIISPEEFVPTTTHQYKIVGIMEKSSSESYISSGYTIITYWNGNITSDINKLNIDVLVKNVDDIYNKINNIAEKNNLDPKSVEFHDSLLRWYGVSDNDNANQMMYGFEAILITIIMISSIIVIYNSFNISITERKRQFGMLSSIGTTSKQIRSMVIKEGLMLSLIGIPLGILFSIIGIGLTLQVINNLNIFDGRYSTELKLVISPLSIFLTIFFGGLTIFISSLIPAIKASRTSPIDAIRLTGDIKIKGKKLKTSKLSRKLFGFEGELALKNMKRNRRKYRSTLISLFVSIILFMTVNGFAEYSFKSSLKVYKDYNFNVSVMGGTNDLYDEVSKLDYIDRYTISNTVQLVIRLDESQINKLALKDLKANNYDSEEKKYIIVLSLSTLGDKEFKRYVKENKQNLSLYSDINNPKIILMNESNFYSMREEHYYQIVLTNLKENDTILLQNGKQDIDTVHIGKISDIYPTGFTNDNITTGSILGYITDDFYNSLDNTLKTETGNMMIQSSNPSKLTKEIESLIKEKNINANVHNVDDAVKTLKNAVLAISIFLYGFIIIVSLITVTNVINTITTSIYLRRREFAMLKAVGMTNISFNKMIRFESLLYGIKSLIYGLPFGILIDYLLYKNVSSVFIYDYKLPYNSIIISFIFVSLIISTTMIYAVRKIKDDNIVDVIKEENI